MLGVCHCDRRPRSVAQLHQLDFIMQILVTGANGQLGNEMQIVSKGSPDRYFFTDVCEGYDRLDIADLEAVKAYVVSNKIDAIVNCAAWTNVDAAEEPDKFDIVEKLNATAPENLAKAMKDVGGLLIHISTDYVFGKESYNTPCKEDQKGTPAGVYGLTKLHGEEKIIATGCKYIIIRTAWLYSEFGRNFCKTMLGLTASKPGLKVVFDQVGTPTYALDLAEAIYKILNERTFAGNTGIYHFSNEGVCSWYDFTKMIQHFSGQTDCKVLPCHSSEFPSPVVRPAFSVLDKTRIKETFGVEVPYWTDSLKRCIDNIKRNNGSN